MRTDSLLDVPPPRKPGDEPPVHVSRSSSRRWSARWFWTGLLLVGAPLFLAVRTTASQHVIHWQEFGAAGRWIPGGLVIYAAIVILVVVAIGLKRSHWRLGWFLAGSLLLPQRECGRAYAADGSVPFARWRQRGDSCCLGR